MRQQISLILFFICLTINGRSQQTELLYKNITQEDGLPSNETYYVFRDSKNYLWIATDKGVVRYNGSKMQYIELPDNVVFKIKEDSKGRIWFFSFSGKLAYFFNERVYPYLYNDRITRQIKSILINDAYVDSTGNIWITADFSNYKISPEGNIDIFPYSNSVIRDTCTFLIKDISQSNVFAWKTAVGCFMHAHLSIKRIVRNDTATYCVSQVFDPFGSALYGSVKDNNGYVYLFMNRFIVRLSKDGTYIKQQLPADILCLFVTAEGNIMVGTKKLGAFLLDPQLKIRRDITILKNVSVSCIAADNENGTWFTTLENGVYYVKNNNIQYITGYEGAAAPVSRLYNFRDSVLLFANSNGIYTLKQQVQLLFRQKNENITDLLIHNRTIYLAGNHILKGRLIFQYTKFHKLNLEARILLGSSGEIIISDSDCLFFSSLNINYLCYKGGQMKCYEGLRLFNPLGFLRTCRTGYGWVLLTGSID
ncbi:two-component regulator propeller domain-containing protein [Chitinophagaceae bacterium MMS25-I14]